MNALHWATALHPDEEAVLRAMRQRQSSLTVWRCKDVSLKSQIPYGRTWRALVRLQRRGYVHQDMLRRWWVSWESVALPHRAQVSIDLLEPAAGDWPPPAAWERVADWVLRHFGGSLEERR